MCLQLVSFLVENSMPLSAAPKLLSLAKSLANDKAALHKMALDDRTASYKLKYGVAQTFRDELLLELRQSPFGLNLDEATNSNHQKVVTVMVSHFSQSRDKVCINHLASFVVTKLTSEGLFDKLDKLFAELELPWTNLLSILMDSCRVMRGERGGLETLIRLRKAPHLIDVDGDSCHHVHNAAKGFCAAFQNHVESLLSSLNTDFKWSSNNLKLLGDMCTILGIKSSTPMEYIPHRWLSVLPAALDTLRMFDVLVLFYFSYLKESDKELYQEVVDAVLDKYKIHQESRKVVLELQKTIKKTFASATSVGKIRKIRITEKLFVYQDKTLLQLHFYCSVLPTLQDFVAFLQKKEPSIHELHNKQEELLRDFLTLFMKPEVPTGSAKST